MLSHVDALPPDESKALISLLSINRNAAVLIDSDRRAGKSAKRKSPMRLNDTKRRIKTEMESIGGLVWITEGKEIENYTPIQSYARVVGKAAPTVTPYTQIVDLPLLRKFKKDKMAIAHAVAPETQKSDLVGHLDVWQRLEELCSNIRLWNGLRS